MQVAISSYEIKNWQYGGASATLRLFADEDYLSTDGEEVINGNSITGAGLYRSIPLTVVGTTVSFPSFSDFPSTTDSPTNRNATWTARLYDYRGVARDHFLIHFRLDHVAGAVQTWAEIISYNTPQGPPPDPTYPTFAQAYLIAQSEVGSLNDASTVVKGRIFTDVDPSSPTTPTAIVINSRRAPAFYNVTASAIGAVGDGTTNNRAFLNTLFNTTLQITGAGGEAYFPAGDYLISSNLTIPANVRLTMDPHARLKPANGVTITDLSDHSLWDNAQKFTNALAGEGTVSLPVSSTASPLWWGAVAKAAIDQTKNDTKPFQAAISSGAGTVVVSDGHYMIDTTTLATGMTKRGLNLASNQTLNMGSNVYLHAINNSSTGPANLLVGWNVSNVVVRGGNLVGDNITNSRTPDANPSVYGLILLGCTNVWVYDLVSQDHLADGFFICYDDEAGSHAECQNVHLINCTGYRNYRQGVSVVGAINWSIEGGFYTSSAGSAPQDGIDIEPNANIHGPGLGSIIRNGTIRGVTCSGNVQHGIEVLGSNGPISNLLISGNYCYSNGASGIVIRYATESRIEGNVCYSNTANGIAILHSTFIDVADNTLRDHLVGYGILLNNTDAVTTGSIKIQGNITTGNSINIGLIGTSGKTLDNVLIDSNIVEDGLDEGIYTAWGVDASISNNHITGNSQRTDNTGDNVLLQNSVRTTVINNIIRRGTGAKQARYGLKIDGSGNSDTIVRNNDLVLGGKSMPVIVDNSSARSDIRGNKLAPVASYGTFTLSAAATTTVTNGNVLSSSTVIITPTNAAAAALMAGAKSLYISAQTDLTSFVVSTADGTSAAGTETFSYAIQ